MIILLCKQIIMCQEITLINILIHQDCYTENFTLNIGLKILLSGHELLTTLTGDPVLDR